MLLKIIFEKFNMTDLKNKFIYCSTILLCLCTLCVPVTAQQVKYTNGNSSWNPDSLGNHRALVQFSGAGKIAKTIIPWRRRDMNPEQKRIIVQDAKTGQKILNVKTVDINRESGIILFEPVSGKGNYYIY